MAFRSDWCSEPTIIQEVHRMLRSACFIVQCRVLDVKPIQNCQTEMSKCILHLPKSTTNNVVWVALKWPSIRAGVLCIKLAFLLKTMNSPDSPSSHVFCSLAIDDVEALQSTRQCRLLETTFNTNLTSRSYPLPTLFQVFRSRRKSWKMTGPPCWQSPQLTLLNLLYTALPSAAGPRYGTIHWTTVLLAPSVLKSYWGY